MQLCQICGYIYITIYSCEKCAGLPSVWQELADNFNNTEDSDIAISKANCSAEPDLCKGKEIQRNTDHIMASK